MPVAVDHSNLGTNGVSGAQSSISLTTTATVANGATIIVGIQWNSATSNLLTSVTDSAGNTYTIDSQVQNGGDWCAVASAPAPSGLASGSTITAHFSPSTSGDNTICAASFTGITGNGYAITQNTTGAPQNWTTATVTTTQGGDMVLAAAINNNAATSSAPNSPAVEDIDFNLNATDIVSFTMAHRIELAPGGYTISGTWAAGGATRLNTIGLAYKTDSPVAPVIEPRQEMIEGVKGHFGPF